MKNKISYIILAIQFIILVIVSYKNQYLKDIIISISSLFSNDIDTINIVYNIIRYVILVIFYLTIGVVSGSVIFLMLSEVKYVIIYTILISSMFVVISMVIKSFNGSIRIIDEIVSFVSLIVGAGLYTVFNYKNKR